MEKMKKSAGPMEDKSNLQKLTIDFFQDIYKLDYKTYARHFLAYILSPVITGIKPASTLTLRNCKKRLRDYWEESKEELLHIYNLDYIELERNKDRLILLVYDRENLASHLNIDENKILLNNFGYRQKEDLDSSLLYLKKRVSSQAFPHESGIFLGIPWEDVEGFIKKEDSIYDGFWKVYQDLDRYKLIFRLYNESKKIYINNYFAGQELSIKNIYSNHRKNIYAACG